MLRAERMGGGQPRPKPVRRREERQGKEEREGLGPTPPLPHAGLGLIFWWET